MMSFYRDPVYMLRLFLSVYMYMLSLFMFEKFGIVNARQKTTSKLCRIVQYNYDLLSKLLVNLA